MTSLAEAALWYATKGIAVLPCNGKVPLLEHGFKEATTDPVVIERWWNGTPTANIGIVPGTGGLLVVDVDVKGVNGHRSLAILEKEHGKLPLTRTAYTPSGGLHRYFRIPRGETFGNTRPAQGIDIRCHRGFVVAPPSVIGSVAYRWSSRAPVAPLPAAWVELLKDKPYAGARDAEGTSEPAPGVVPGGHNARVAYLKAAYNRELDKLLNAPDGDGNNQVCRFGFNLGQLIGYGMSEQNIRDGAEWVFSQWNWRKRGDIAAARRTLESGIQGGKAKPRKAMP